MAWAAKPVADRDVSMLRSPRTSADSYESACLDVMEGWTVMMLKASAARITTREVRNIFGVDADRLEDLALDLS